jgi:hypothetical protein
MKKWLRRILGAVGMSLTWAAGWGLVGVLIGMFVDPHGSIDDMWVVTLGVPGFLGGVVFSAVLGIAEGRRRFDELPLSRFGFWGRWLVCCWACFRLLWGRRIPNSRRGCWV